MKLCDFNYAPSYNKAEDDIAELFYLPCMRSAIKYDRISGYFGSTIYILAWAAIKDFIKNNGKIRIICSPYISEADEDALTEGYTARTDEVLSRALEDEVAAMFDSPSLAAPVRLLAYLVSEGIIDVKLAIPTSKASASAKRLFHDKVGVFYDSTGAAVGFRGSMNETFKGLASDGNIESIDVFPSWMDERDKQRANEASRFFESLWNYDVAGISVFPFPNAVKEILKVKANNVNWLELLDEIQVIENTSEKWKPSQSSDAKTPRPHQTDALEAWVANGRRGIFEHATGSGKTFTAMCAINNALQLNEVVLVLVPSRDLLKQWDNELRKTLKDFQIHYLLCGDGNSGWKKLGALQSWTSKGAHSHRIILATMDTASSDEFIHKMSQGSHLFLVADEVHRLGSPKRRNILKLLTGARLGLSATPYRYGDPEGTSALFEYFGGLIPPPFTLSDAIKSGVLTRYFYHPQSISLSKTEQIQWDSFTEQIKTLVARTGNKGDTKIDINSNQRLKQLLINRARVIKNATGKIPLALEILKKQFKAGQRWIIYCDNIVQLKAVLNDALNAGFDAYEYYASMVGDRDTTLDYFEENGGVLVSIKCLDEGVDIPSTTHALILASSQNPREFIQRRGRILRNSPKKLFAHLYDAITVPVVEDDDYDKTLSIINAELSRAIQFGQGAENPACVTDLKSICIDFHIDFNTIKDGGIEDDDE